MTDGWRAVVVWDWPTRLFHWALVVLVVAAYVAMRVNRMDLHVAAGAAVLALVVFRVGWGVVGSDTARFRRFLGSPLAALHHLRGLLRREADVEVGHNRAGGWMVVLLLALLLGETLTGVVANNDVADAGPLTEMMPARLANLVTDLHGWIWNALLAAIAAHVAAILVYAAVKRQNLVRAMVTGRKMLPERIPAPFQAPVTRAVVLLLASAALAWLVVSYG